MRVNPLLVPVLVIVALLGTVFAAQSIGMWTTSGRTTVEAAQLNPADIKGWMTLQQVIDGLPIDKSALYQAGGIPADISADTALKDLEGVVLDFEISTLRDTLAAPRTELSESTPPAEATPVPAPATATPVIAQTAAAHATPTSLPAGVILPGSDIKGRMTLAEVTEQCVVPLDALLAALGLPSDTDANVAIKDLVSQGKLSEVSVVQQAVTTLQSK